MKTAPSRVTTVTTVYLPWRSPSGPYPTRHTPLAAIALVETIEAPEGVVANSRASWGSNGSVTRTDAIATNALNVSATIGRLAMCSWSQSAFGVGIRGARRWHAGTSVLLRDLARARDWAPLRIGMDPLIGPMPMWRHC